MSVLALPIPQRLCSNCEHGFSGLTGVFCVEFNEPIDNEKAEAESCVMFEPVPFPDVTVTVNGAKVDSTIEYTLPTTTVEALTDDELVAACDRWLASRNVTLWGQHFEVVSKSGRRGAARWLAEQIRSLGASRDREQSP